MPATAVTYADLRFPNHALTQAHPERLAADALLHGLQPPDPARCRYLELGGGTGGNAIGVAFSLPGARVVNMDISPDLIEEGRADAQALGVSNLELITADLRDMESLGEFDYVVCHGVYSWVDDGVREALMSAVAAHLAPGGLAYISYTANPGGHLRRVLREAGLWHARDTTSFAERAEKGRELLSALVELRAGDSPDPYAEALRSEAGSYARADLGELGHDLFEDDWHTSWFHEFTTHAAAHGLEYVGEARGADLRRVIDPPEGEERLRELARGDRINYEQLLDIFGYRRFRESILCHAGREATWGLAPGALERVRFTARLPKEADAPGLPRDVAGHIANARPGLVSLDELRSAFPGADAEAALLEGIRQDWVSAVAGPARAVMAGERPTASPLARREIERGKDVLTSLLHTPVRFEDPLARRLVMLLDGTRDREAIARDFAGDGPPLRPDALEHNLTQLGQLSLLQT
jgi:SAM-dependent methyltransferase